MSLISTLTDGVSSLLTGGTLGILGAIGTGVLDIFKTKEKNKHDLAMITANIELAKASGNNLAVIEAIKLAGSSYEHDKAAYVNAGFVDIIRGLVRPILTTYLVVISSILAIWAFRKVGVEPVVVAEISKYSVSTCLELTSICIVWYFGSREIRKMHNGDK